MLPRLRAAEASPRRSKTSVRPAPSTRTIASSSALPSSNGYQLEVKSIRSVRWSAAGAELQRGDELQRRGSLDELTRELTGAPLPVLALFDWLAGRASEASGWQADLSARPQGRLVARRAQPAPAAELRLVVQ